MKGTENTDMVYDLQKANAWKRISAFLLDFILFAILAIGVAFTISSISGYDGYNDKLSTYYDKYQNQYGVDFQISEEEYNTLSESEAERYNEAYEALSKDKEATYYYQMVVSLSLLITSVSIFIGFLIYDFLIPLFLKNGQTPGKKIFGIGLVRVDCVKTSNLQLFIRTILGKYVLETMIPVFILMMMYFNMIGMLGTIIIGLILILQAILYITTGNHSFIHDLLSGTVVVDMSSQMIFDTPEQMIEYKKKLHAADVAKKEY